jgi:hypothetical protein
VTAGGVALAGGFVLFDSRNVVTIYLGVALLAAGNGVMWPSVLSVLSEAAGNVYQGAVQGAAGSLGAVASIVGLTAGGVLYTTLGAGIFAASAGVILVSALMGLTLGDPAGSPP